MPGRSPTTVVEAAPPVAGQGYVDGSWLMTEDTSAFDGLGSFWLMKLPVLSAHAGYVHGIVLLLLALYYVQT